MNIQRGDVVKARFPHASGERGKKRPVVVIQADSYNRRLRHAVVAEVTGNLEGKGDPACLFVDSSTPEAQAAGLTRDCLISGYLLTLMSEERLQERIGSLSAETMSKLDVCLKAALGLG
jgi:mRNA interferase MazF